MKIKESVKVYGYYEIEQIDKNGKVINYSRSENVVVQNFFDLVFARMDTDTESAAGLNLTHFAVGTGSAVAQKSDTLLETEIFRKSITQKSYTSTKFTCRNILAPLEAVGNLLEFGIFADATGVADSGTLISRVNVDIDKNSSTQYAITYNLVME